MSEKRVLFLGHDASRTGAPLILLEIIKWLKENSAIKMEIYLRRGGDIEADYRRVAPTFSPNMGSQGFFGQVIRRLQGSDRSESKLVARYQVEKYPVIYANTIDTCNLAMRLAGPSRYVIHHVHELAYATESYRATDTLRSAVATTDLYIAASEAVKRFLVDVIYVPDSKIQVVHEFPIAVQSKGKKEGGGRDIRLGLGIPEDAFVIGMCGTPEWRKGIDVFVQVMLEVRKLGDGMACHFVWLGGHECDFAKVRYDVCKLDLQDCCHFVPAVENPESYFGAFNLFALTSREDPFPLVMLEAAASGLPIVCFADSGGAPELVESDAGMVVPYLDAPAMARACMDLVANEPLRRQFGERAKVKVQSRYLLAVQGPKIRSLIESAFEFSLARSQTVNDMAAIESAF